MIFIHLQSRSHVFKPGWLTSYTGKTISKQSGELFRGVLNFEVHIINPIASILARDQNWHPESPEIRIGLSQFNCKLTLSYTDTYSGKVSGKRHLDICLIPLGLNSPREEKKENSRAGN